MNADFARSYHGRWGGPSIVEPKYLAAQQLQLKQSQGSLRLPSAPNAKALESYDFQGFRITGARPDLI